MLDILNLATDSKQTKTYLNDQLSKQQKFNQIMDKLRQRNAANDNFIKKYIKKTNKKKIKLPSINPCIQNHSSQNQCQKNMKINQTYFYQTTLQTNFQEKENLTSEQIPLKNSFKNTNHTLTEQPFHQENKANNLPNLELSSNKTHSQILSPSKPKQNLQALRQDKSFNKYLKNIFFKQISQKLQPKPIIPPKYQPRKSQARISTEMSSSKYQLSIKSLVFGIKESDTIKRQERKQIGSKKIESVTKELIKDMEKYDRDYQFYDDKLNSKVMLPVIHNFQPPKNRRFLEKYIKFNNNEKSFKFPSTETKLMTLPTEHEVLSSRDTPSRIGLSLRIQTIQIQKN